VAPPRPGRDFFPFAQFPALDTLLHHQRDVTEAIERARGVTVPWVFHRNGKRISDCRGSWWKALTAAGLQGRIMHDLRLSAVRNLGNAGVPELTAMKLTGHKARAVFDPYNIISTAETAGRWKSSRVILRLRNATKRAQSARRRLHSHQQRKCRNRSSGGSCRTTLGWRNWQTHGT
jgi:hypothetical protein